MGCFTGELTLYIYLYNVKGIEVVPLKARLVDGATKDLIMYIITTLDPIWRPSMTPAATSGWKTAAGVLVVVLPVVGGLIALIREWRKRVVAAEPIQEVLGDGNLVVNVGSRSSVHVSGIPAAAPASKLTSAAQDEGRPDWEDFSEVHEGVLWRGGLMFGKVHSLSAHCPGCRMEVRPKLEHRGSYGQHFDCDNCHSLNIRIEGSKRDVEDRIRRKVQAGWIRRGEESPLPHPSLPGGGA